VEGLGRRESIPARLARASGIVLVDLPLALHLRLAEARHAGWSAGRLDHPPAGLREAPPLEAVLRTIREVDRDWMPDIRRWAEAASRSARLLRVASLDELDALARAGWSDGS
jgi:hypothetical protein